MLEYLIKRTKKNSLFNTLKNKFPYLTLYLIVKPISRFRYPDERALENGRGHYSSNEEKSIIFFTAHKCASTLVTKVIQQLIEDKKMASIDFESYFSTVDIQKYALFQQSAFMKRAFKPKGYYYGAFRHYRDIPDIENYHVILVLRDPRDVITSSYYSTAYSHMPIGEKLLAQRKEALQMDIDDYVINKAEEFNVTYQKYIDKLIGLPNVLFLKYEDMVESFPTWLKKLSLHIDADQNKELLDGIISENDFTVSKEDKYSHVRSVQPGDHTRKLRPATITKLNDIFEKVLVALDYK